MESFETTPGAADTKGVDYENLNVAGLVLQLVKNENVQNFYISANDDSFKGFDDIVVKIEQDNSAEYFAIQLKHVENIANTITQTKLKHHKGKFSLNTYFLSFKKTFSLQQKCTYVLFTNALFEYTDNMQFQIHGEHFNVKVEKYYPNNVFDISNKTQHCYKFQIVEEPSTLKHDDNVEDYRTFFDNFFIYADQENVKNLRESISKKFKNMFSCGEREFEQYVKMISAWCSKKKKREKLNKVWMQRGISLCIMSSRIQPLSFAEVDRKMKIFREAVSAFDVTVVGRKYCRKIKQLWGDAFGELDDLKEINKLREHFQLAPDYVDNVDKINETLASQLLWLMGKCPLIVYADESVYKATELCSGSKFILLGEASDKPRTTLSIFQNLSDLKFAPAVYEEMIMNFTYSLQGKEKLSLHDLFKENDEFVTFFNTDDLLEMSDGSYNIGGKKEVLPQPYIERYVSPSLIDVKYLEDLSDGTLIIINCGTEFDLIKKKFSQHKFVDLDKFLEEEGLISGSDSSEIRSTSRHVSKNYNMKSHLEKSNIGTTILLSSREAEYQEFQAIYNKDGKVKVCHQFKYRPEGHLEWIRSEGDVSNLEKYTLHNDYSVEEKLLWQSQPKNYVNVIISDPGMGKTELVKSFKNNSPSNFWTVALHPKDIYSLAKHLVPLRGEDRVIAVQAFLLEEKYSTLAKRDQEFFKFLLNHGNVIFVWDGLDEISSEHLEAVTDTINQLSKKGLFQWITSRRRLKPFLEEKFNVMSLDISQFNDEQQQFYFEKRLEDVSSVEKTNRIIEKIKTMFLLVEHRDILGIPLQIFMITELLRQDIDKYFNLLTTVFTLTDLYHYFIEEKFNIYYREKARLDLQNSHVQFIVNDAKRHTLKRFEGLALLTLFPVEILERLNVNVTKIQQSLQDNHVSIGLVTDVTSKIPRFVHSSFAEYFTAVYFFQKLELRKIIKEVIFDQKYSNVRFFFDLLLAKNSTPHIAVLYNNFDFIKTCDAEILTQKDAGGRSVLHLASSWGQQYPRLSIQKVKKTYVIDDTSDLYVAADAKEYLEMLEYLFKKCNSGECDEVFNMNILSYAQKSKCLAAELNIIQKKNIKVSHDDAVNILYYSARFGYDNVLDLFASKNVPFIKTKKYDETLLHLAVAHKPYVEKLLKNNNYKKKINAKDSSGNTPLHLSSYSNSHETASVLVNRGAKINERNSNGLTSVFIASGFGHRPSVELLLSHDADLNIPDNNGFTPLYVAAQKKHEPVVEFLLQNDAKVNVREKGGFTPLHLACYDGDENLVRYLVSSEAKVHRVNNDGFTPLHLACQQGHERIVNFLLTRHVNVNATNNDGFTPLHISCQNGHEKIVEILVQSKAKINVTTNDQVTPLYLAALKGHENIARFLIASGAGVAIADYAGFTPLHVAAQEGYQSIVELLVSSNSRVNRANKQGFTPLHLACQNGHKDTVEFLIASGASLNCRDAKGFRPLHIACQNEHEPIVTLLISSHAEVDSVDDEGFAALHIACHSGFDSIARILIEAGANINRFNRDGFTPLYLACQNGHTETAVFLIDSGADINLANNYGFTPLHIVSSHGDEELVKLLVTSGASLNCSNVDGHTPLHVAWQNERKNVYDYLFSCGGRMNSAFQDHTQSQVPSAKVQSKRLRRFF